MTQAQVLSVLMEFRTVKSSERVHHGTELNTDWLVNDPGNKCVDGIQNNPELRMFPSWNRAKTLTGLLMTQAQALSVLMESRTVESCEVATVSCTFSVCAWACIGMRTNRTAQWQRHPLCDYTGLTERAPSSASTEFLHMTEMSTKQINHSSVAYK